MELMAGLAMLLPLRPPISFKDFIYLFLERGEGREKERKRIINVWLPLKRLRLGTWTTTQACALDWESNQRPFGLQAGGQSTELHQSGLVCLLGATLVPCDLQQLLPHKQLPPHTV